MTGRPLPENSASWAVASAAVVFGQFLGPDPGDRFQLLVQQRAPGARGRC
ncbi:hypothetical protein [Nocardia sp. X0981]